MFVFGISAIALRGAVELGLIYSLAALGVFLSYRVLDVADLTVDGSFTLGAAVCTVATLAGHPLLAVPLAMAAGALAGFATALLQTKLKVQPILAGIITMTALYSLNLRVMGGKSNLPMLKTTTLYDILGAAFPPKYAQLALIVLFALCAGVALTLFLRTQLGLSIRATGDNPDMVRSSSINPDHTKTIGLCIANSLVALSGALLAPYQLFADISMGIGTVVMALASLIIGEVLMSRRNIPLNIAAAIIGSVLYRFIITAALSSSISQSDMKLLSAVIVAAAISYPAIQNQYRIYKLKKAGERSVKG